MTSVLLLRIRSVYPSDMYPGHVSICVFKCICMHVSGTTKTDVVQYIKSFLLQVDSGGKIKTIRKKTGATADGQSKDQVAVLSHKNTLKHTRLYTIFQADWQHMA